MKNVTIILLVLAAVVLSCKLPDSLTGKSSSDTSNSSNSASTSKPVTSGPATSSGDPKADIVAASKKFIDLPSFTANMDGTGTADFHTKVEYISPDRYHITQGGNKMETIIVGKDTYMNTGGTWRKFPVDVGSMIPNLRESYTEEGLKTLSDVKYVGEETLDGRSALVYTYTSTSPKIKTPFTSKMWVGKDSGLPLKAVIDYTGIDLKQMVIVYDTETPVKIEAPIGK